MSLIKKREGLRKEEISPKNFMLLLTANKYFRKVPFKIRAALLFGFN
jgi:hypothetical protein